MKKRDIRTLQEIASDELVRSLESNTEDDDVHSSSNVYKNAVTSAGERVLREASKSFQSNPDVRTFSALHSNPAAQTGMITGVVQLILTHRTFAQNQAFHFFVQRYDEEELTAQYQFSCQFVLPGLNAELKKFERLGLIVIR